MLSDQFVILEAAPGSIMAGFEGRVLWDLLREEHPEVWRSITFVEDAVVSDGDELTET